MLWTWVNVWENSKWRTVGKYPKCTCMWCIFLCKPWTVAWSVCCEVILWEVSFQINFNWCDCTHEMSAFSTQRATPPQSHSEVPVCLSHTQSHDSKTVLIVCSVIYLSFVRLRKLVSIQKHDIYFLAWKFNVVFNQSLPLSAWPKIQLPQLKDRKQINM